MSEHGREILGRLSHWCLLGLGAAVLLCWGGVVITSAATSHDEFACNLVAPDALVRAKPKNQYIGGVVTGVSRSRRVALYHMNGMGLSVSAGEDSSMVFKLPAGLPPGDYSIDIRGNPYSAIAAVRQTAMMRVSAHVKRLYLLEASLVLDAINGGARQRAALADAIAMMKRSGEVAAFCDGPVDEYPRAAEALRRRGWEEPLLWNDPDHAWRFVAWEMWVLNLPADKVTIVVRPQSQPPRGLDVRAVSGGAAAGEAIHEEIASH